MRHIGFSTISTGVTSVFIGDEVVGVIRTLSGGEVAFVPGKKRKTMDADALRAIAVKIEMMEKKDD